MGMAAGSGTAASARYQTEQAELKAIAASRPIPTSRKPSLCQDGRDGSEVRTWRTTLPAHTSRTASPAGCACASRPAKGDRAYFEGAVDKLSGEPSIRSVRASARTGSITIEHDGHAREVAFLAREAGLFDLPEAAVAHLLAEGVAGKFVDVDAPSLVSSGLAGMGVYQAARGNVLGSGVEHIWQAYSAARTLGRPGIAAVLALLGAYQIPGDGCQPGGVAVLLRADGARHERMQVSRGGSPCRKTQRQVQRGRAPGIGLDPAGPVRASASPVGGWKAPSRRPKL